MTPSTARSPILPSSRLTRDERGTVAVITGLVLTLVVGVTGGAIDFGRVMTARSELQAALDSAILVAGRKLQVRDVSEGEAIAAANAYFQTNKSELISSSTLDITITDGTKVKGVLKAKVPATFVAVLGIPEFEVELRTSVQLAAGGSAGGNLEIAVALDVTGSMCDDGVGPCTGGSKLTALKTAAKDLVNIVVWEDQSRYTSKLALVPFSTRIRVGPDGGGGDMMKALTGLNARWSGYMRLCTAGSGSGGSEGNGNWSCSAAETRYVTDWKLAPCITDRTGYDEHSDARPSAGAWLNAHDGTLMPFAEDSSGTVPASGRGQSEADPSYQWNYTDGGYCEDVRPSNELAPLTADRHVLMDRINGLEAYGATSGALATAFTWYALSPEWSSVWPSSSRPGSYGDLSVRDNGVPRLRKVAVIMSDGVFNTFRGWKNQSQQDVSSRARSICSAMKAKGIEIYTVAFNLDSLPTGERTTAEETLRACGTDLQHFYNALDAEQLLGAFRDIALKVATMRLSE
ncbi:MAG: pilus assembly protein [Hyphomicrobiaceae bacterium]